MRGASCTPPQHAPVPLLLPARLWKLAEPEKTLNELRRMKAEDLSFEQVGAGLWVGRSCAASWLSAVRGQMF